MFSDSIQPNDWSERYQFRQLLGQGGMGVVYLAEDKERSDALCVIKQLILRPASKHEHAEAIRLFKREAQVLQSLNHPGIVRFFDSHAAADGQYFLVMDYLPGETLEPSFKRAGRFFVAGNNRNSYSMLRNFGIFAQARSANYLS